MNTSWMLNTKIAILLMLCTISGCSQEAVQSPTPYDGCCGTEPKVYEVEDYRVYIPNVITPNEDGINDAFYPICNKMEIGKFAVANYQIFNDTGKLIYYLQGLDIIKPASWGFRGFGWQRPFKPQVHERVELTGKFKYSFVLAFRKADNTEFLLEVEGEACVVRCDANAHVIKMKEGCYFPVQGATGIYNALINANEDSCIK